MVEWWLYEFTPKLFYLLYVEKFSKLNIGEKNHYPTGTINF